MRDLVLAIHATPHKAVMAITGGGAEAIGKLLRYGQGSNTLLEAVVPYSNESFNSFVHGTPDKYCSPGAARDLAMAAFQRAMTLTPGDTQLNLVGVGASSSLIKDNERVGREHHAFIAVQTATNTICYDLDLGNVVRTRVEQEYYVGSFIVHVLASACGVQSLPFGTFKTEVDTASPGLMALIIGNKSICVFDTDLIEEDKLKNRVIFPGSFNPIHDQHVRMAQVVHESTGKRIDLEVCVHNVDKPAINYHDLNRRGKYLKSCIEHNPWGGDLFFTALPTFAQKASRFKGANFIVGWDTFARIADPKYGNVTEVIRTFCSHNITFTVFDRIINSEAASANTQKFIPPALMDLATIRRDVKLLEMSSSDIRKGKILL